TASSADRRPRSMEHRSMLRDGPLPQEDEIFAAIEEIFVQGVRRPGYPADRWAEEWIAMRFRDLGLERVRHEAVPLPRWEPRRWSLEVSAPAPGSPGEIDCFPLPHPPSPHPTHPHPVASAPAAPERVRGCIARAAVPLMRGPRAAMARLATWAHAPAGTFPDATHVLPFGREFMAVMEPAIAAGAVGFVGVLDGYPGDSKDYF